MAVNEQRLPTKELQHLPRWNCKRSPSFAARVLDWAHDNLSDFPWRQRESPYEILVAEVLLKRTTATAAARVYVEFFFRFPALQDIASATEEELVEVLSKLGLQHQRARSMKELAAWILSRHAGCIPCNLEELLKVPGLGDYSARAILTFGYGIPSAVLDTNVERILVRVFGDVLPPRPSWTLLHEIAQDLLPCDGHREYNFGLLDLGRLVCRNVQPKCEDCPLASVCAFFLSSSGQATSQSKVGKAAEPPSKLRAIRHDRGLSLKRLAEAAKVSKNTVIRIETGRTFPRRETLEKLAKALRVSAEELAGPSSQGREPVRGRR